MLWWMRVEPDVGRPGPVFLLAVAVADEEEFAGVGHEVTHRRDAVSPDPQPLRPDNDRHGSIRTTQKHALPFFHDVVEHSRSSRIDGRVQAPRPLLELARGAAGRGAPAAPPLGRGGERDLALMETVHFGVAELRQHAIDRLGLGVAVVPVDRLDEACAGRRDETHALVEQKAQFVGQHDVAGVESGNDKRFAFDGERHDDVFTRDGLGHERHGLGVDAHSPEHARRVRARRVQGATVFQEAIFQHGGTRQGFARWIGPLSA